MAASVMVIGTHLYGYRHTHALQQKTLQILKGFKENGSEGGREGRAEQGLQGLSWG